jgi:hypothetical protein
LLTELIVATLMVMLTVFVHTVGLLLLRRLVRYESFEEQTLHIQPYSFSGILLTMSIVLGLLLLHGLEIWLYAILYLELDAVQNLRDAVFFSTQTYAAIGFSYDALTPEWRLVAAIEGINGVVLLGWSTAFFVTVIRRLSDF